VLDPQKYADASIHQRYVTELAGHDAVTVFVLNQCDRLSPEEQAECLADLRDLLKREGLANPRVIATSAVTGQGIAELTDVLAEAVASRRAAYERLEADLDQLTPRLAKELSGARPVEPEVDAARRGALTDALCDAVGVSAIGETMENLYGVRSIEWVGWPYARWAAKLRPDPASSLRLGNLREELRSLVGSSVGAQPAEVERAVENLTEAVTDGMPDAWRAGVREVARSRSAELPEALSRELSSLTPPLDRVPRWWWLLKVWQYALVAVFVAGLGLIGAILAYGVFEVARPPSPFFSDVSLLPWLGLIVVCVLGLGLLSAVASKNFVVLEAGKERERMEREMRRRVADLAQRMVIEPVEQELRRYNEFFEAFGSVRR